MNEARATRYQRLRRRAHGAALASGASMLAGVALTPVGAWLAGAASAYGRGAPVWAHALASMLLFVACLVVLWEIAALPWVLYLGRTVNPRYGAPATGIDDLIVSQAKATLVVLPVASAAAVVVQWSAYAAGVGWWLVAGALLGALMVCALHWMPGVIARLAGARPLANPALADRLEVLARQAGVLIAGVEEIDDGGGRLTAIVTGTGRARRVFVSSALVRDWSDEEIAVVVAHELAHHAHNDLWRTVAVDGSVLAAGLLAADLILAATGAGAAADLAALPLVALAAGGMWLAATPLRNAYSRRQERRADAFALRLTGSAGAFSAAVRRLATRHLAEERPSALTRWLYHRHPPVADRLALAEAFAERGSPGYFGSTRSVPRISR